MANIITCIRIVCGAALLFCTPFSPWFYLIYIVGGLSGVLDGIVARRLKNESKFGAGLDTVAAVWGIMTCITATAASIQEMRYVRSGKEVVEQCRYEKYKS